MMRPAILLSSFVMIALSGAHEAPLASEAQRPTGNVSGHSQPSLDTLPQAGRFQLVVVPQHSGSPFLIDTMTGCVWQQIQNQDTKRTSFAEADVENLHWSWGSGAQQVLASKVDASNLADDQKKALKESLQKTGCGLSNVVLTPNITPPSKDSGK